MGKSREDFQLSRAQSHKIERRFSFRDVTPSAVPPFPLNNGLDREEIEFVTSVKLRDFAVPVPQSKSSEEREGNGE